MQVINRETGTSASQKGNFESGNIVRDINSRWKNSAGDAGRASSCGMLEFRVLPDQEQFLGSNWRQIFVFDSVAIIRVCYCLWQTIGAGRLTAIHRKLGKPNAFYDRYKGP
jgi:hypothetical protein